MSPSTWSGGGGYNNPLELLWQDGERIFCRTWRDGTCHCVLAVLPAAEHPTPASLQRLKHEYALKDQLDAAWALRPLDLVRVRQQTMLVPYKKAARRAFESIGQFLASIRVGLRLVSAFILAAVGNKKAGRAFRTLTRMQTRDSHAIRVYIPHS